MKKPLLLVAVTICSVCCSKKNNDAVGGGGTTTNPVIPTLTTTAISAVTPVSAQTGGNITADGGAPVTARGVCWGSSSGPTISGSKTEDGQGTGTFAGTITGLTANTTYYVRAYATNSKGTAYGNEISFSTQSVQLPVITTNTTSSVKQTSAQSGGSISSDGGASVTARGICWNTSPNPTIADKKTVTGTGTGSFSSILSGLSFNTTYYVRAYATNSAGTSYSSQVTLTTLPLSIAGSGVTDIDGNSYSTVILADREWMGQNLNVSKYRNGNVIPNITDSALWGAATSGAWCYYDNSSVATVYGKLYNWYAVNDNRQVCPTGWHVPTDKEFDTLSTYLGGWTVAGGALKEAGMSHWVSPNTGATNSSGFTAVPGGIRKNITGNGFFSEMGSRAYYWTSINAAVTNGAFFDLLTQTTNFQSGNYNGNTSGMSIRCIKD